MAIGENELGEYAREQLEAARHDPRLDRGHGGMVADFGAAIEEVERTRMMAIIGLQEIRRFYQREREEFDKNGGNQQREYDLQVYWQRAELAQAETENGHPSINAQALIGLYSALDALIEQFAPALRDLPFLARMKEAEKQVSGAAAHLTPELREQMITTLQKLLKVPKLRQLEKKDAARYERRLRPVGLGARCPIPQDLDQALREIGVIRDLLIHRAGRVDKEALEKASSLVKQYKDGELIRLSDEDYRTYSAAIRWYGAEVIHRVYRKPSDDADSDDWRQHYIVGA
ncbi:MAG: hypothetical protein ACXVBB_18935 [Isosphaeraceae bacterium]